jgi:hypothetical protein
VNNWKRGISAAKGTLVKVLFSDDLLNREYLAKTVPLWDTGTPPGFVYTGFGFVGTRNVAATGGGQAITETSEAFLWKSLVVHGEVPVTLSAGLFTKHDLLEALAHLISPPVNRIFDFLGTGVGYDQAVYLYGAAKARWVVRIPETLVYFGSQADSITMRTNRERPGSLFRGYLWAQLCFIKRAYARRPIVRQLLLSAVLAHLIKHNFRYHPWTMKLLPPRC